MIVKNQVFFVQKIHRLINQPLLPLKLERDFFSKKLNLVFFFFLFKLRNFGKII